MYWSKLENDELFISPHVKLSRFSQEARIGNIKLAKKFLVKCLPIFQKCYGNETTLKIIQSSSGQFNSISKPIGHDTKIIKEILKTSNMAPNKKVNH